RALADLTHAADLAGDQRLAARTEGPLVDEILRQIRTGVGLDRLPSVPFVTEAARRQATELLAQLLAAPVGRDVIFLALAWAREAGIDAQRATMRQLGRDVVAPAVLDGQVDEAMRRATRDRPDLRAGAIAQVEATARTDLRRVMGAVLDHAAADALWLGDEDVPGLLRDVLAVAESRRGRTAPVQALAQVVRRRRRANWTPRADSALLRELWPNRSWRPGEALDVLRMLSP